MNAVNNDFPLTVPALVVEQPLGTFFVVCLTARVLLQVAYSDRLTAHAAVDGSGYLLEGTQRRLLEPRLRQVADYIGRTDSSFPNAIILAANHRDPVEPSREMQQTPGPMPEATGTKDGVDEDATGDDWTVVEPVAGSGCWRLTIPTAAKLAAVIDGQHRLFAFPLSKVTERLDMPLLCAVFLDLPRPFQAQLFATINSTQKRVDKSLTYEMFGYNIADEPERNWTPDKLAVFLARKLNTEQGSPLEGRVIVAPKRDATLEALMKRSDWKVSMAVVVEGIQRLISSNPKRDTTIMLTPPQKTRAALATARVDRSPLRKTYIEQNDAAIYAATLNYLKACESVFWKDRKPGSFIIKTVGIQALFDVLRLNIERFFAAGDVRVSSFADFLREAANIDFSGESFLNASGSGRVAIRRAIESRLPIS